MALAFSTRDTLALKGAAIFGIVLHNYFVYLGPVKVNEFSFAYPFQDFATYAIQPHHTVQALFAFLGQYGVQAFMFLSAYGLAKRYWETPWTRFFLARLRKLYPLVLLVLCPWLAVSIGFGLTADSFVKTTATLLLTLTGLLGITPGFGLPAVGPWWFLSFIVEWYCMWGAMRWFTDRFGLRGMVWLSAAALIFTQFSYAALARYEVNLLETPIGHMPELCLGIAAARYRVNLSAPVAVFALAALVLGNSYPALWLLTFPAALIIALYVFSLLKDRAGWLATLGKRSMRLFLVNGIVELPFLTLAAKSSWALAVLLGVISAAVSFALAEALPPLSKLSLEPAGLGQRAAGQRSQG